MKLVFNPETVTQITKRINQPGDGFIPISALKTVKYYDDKTLNKQENLHPITVGLVVDYLTRYHIHGDIALAFGVSLRGAQCYDSFCHTYRAEPFVRAELKKIEQNDDIMAAARVTMFDDYYRRGVFSTLWPQMPVANLQTQENIRIMVQRGVDFLKLCSNQIFKENDFEDAFTDKICNADCDYVTDSSLIDFKVSKYGPSAQHTLQLLLYWRLGMHSRWKKRFKQLQWLVIFNPRKNQTWYYPIDNISDELIDLADNGIIGYDKEYRCKWCNEVTEEGT